MGKFWEELGSWCSHVGRESMTLVCEGNKKKIESFQS